MTRTETTTRHSFTPVAVCQAIHDVPYHVARFLIRICCDVARCAVWTADAIAMGFRQDAASVCAAFMASSLVSAVHAARRAPSLVGFMQGLRMNPLIRLVTMIALMAVLMAFITAYEPQRTVDAITIIVDDEGHHVLTDDSDEETYNGLLLRRSIGLDKLQAILEPNRTVTVNHGSTVEQYDTKAERLAAFFQRHNIVLGEAEMVELDTTGEELSIHISDTLTYQHYVVVETDYETKRSPDPLMDKGTERVLRKGVKGQVIETYEDTVVGGEVVSTRYVGASHDTSHAELILYGTRVYEVERDDTIVEDHPYDEGEGGYLLFASGDTMTYSKVLACRSTAYYSGGEGGAAWTTAVGASVGIGTIAVDPTVIPYYTKMFIQSTNGRRVYGMGTALDCGGAIKGNIVDLWFPTRADCYRWGNSNVTVYILDKKA